MQRPNNKPNGARVKRGAKPINDSLNKRLAVYALAAGAAGVGVLALAPAAQASIILDTTPITITASSTEYLTINGNHVISFHATNSRFGPNHASANGDLVANGLNGAGVLAGRIATGSAIGTGGAFRIHSILAHNELIPGTAFSDVAGPWANKSGYLGFKFMSNAKSYFGWAHLSVKANAANGETGVISSFAYDNVARQSILAGEKPTSAAEPGALTLSLLALGAVGLFELRRRLVVRRS